MPTSPILILKWPWFSRRKHLGLIKVNRETDGPDGPRWLLAKISVIIRLISPARAWIYTLKNLTFIFSRQLRLGSACPVLTDFWLRYWFFSIIQASFFNWSGKLIFLSSFPSLVLCKKSLPMTCIGKSSMPNWPISILTWPRFFAGNTSGLIALGGNWRKYRWL